MSSPFREAAPPLWPRLRDAEVGWKIESRDLAPEPLGDKTRDRLPQHDEAVRRLH